MLVRGVNGLGTHAKKKKLVTETTKKIVSDVNEWVEL